MAVRDFTDFISHFDVVKQNGESYKCRCPCSGNHKHRDKKASLSIKDAGDKVLLNCFSGCNVFDILAAVGLEKSDLYYGSDKDSDYKRPYWITWIEEKVSKREGKPERYVKHWDHIYSDGRYACTKIKFCPKTFSIGVFTNDKHEKISNGLYINGKSVQKKDMAAFYTPDYAGFKKAVADGVTVHYAEGEKNCDVLNKLGYQAVTCGSSNDWNSDVAKIFTGAKQVIIWQDNDKPGKKLAKEVYRDISKVAEEVQIITPCPEVSGGDVADLLNLYGAKAVHRMAKFDKFQFHLYTEKVDKDTGEVTKKISGVYDYEIFKFLKLTRSILVCGQVVYMYQDGVFSPDISGAKLKSAIRDLIFPRYVKSNTIKRIYDLFLSDEELQTIPENFNQQPCQWVCFLNGYYDPISKRMMPHNPKYQTLNQWPHEYHPEEKPKGEKIEPWLQSIMEPDEREMMLQYAAYAGTTDVTQQVFMVIVGLAGTGKSTLINLIISMIGAGNTSSVALEELSQRFSAYNMMGRLLNACADLSIEMLTDVKVLKKISGEDWMMAEAKGKQAVPFKNYSKLLFSTNQLPTIQGERTEAFYRRTLILPMNKKPEKRDPTFFGELEEEIDYLIHLCMDALGRMYEAGVITKSKSSVKAVRQLWIDSDVTQAFLDKKTVDDPNGKVARTKLFAEFEAYCKAAERQALTKNNFFRAMRTKGISEGKSSGEWYFKGISLSEDDSSDGWLKASEEDIADLMPF